MLILQKISVQLFFILLLQSSFVSFAIAQTVRGKITDSLNNPIPHATIHAIPEVIDKQRTSRTELTNDSGVYLFTNIGLGKTKFEISLVNYQKVSLTIEVLKDTTLYTTLLLDPQMLATVTVNAAKPIIERKVDRLVFNVENSILNKGVNALDVLKEAPRIEVDEDGSIKMIGKNGLGLMIDGRILNLAPEEINLKLKSLRSEDISKIEIISIPPAKYSSQGNSGLINIVLKKNPTLGWQSAINVEYAQRIYASTNQTANFNYTSTKLRSSFDIGNYHSNILNESTLDFYTLDNGLQLNRRLNGISNMLSFNGNIEYVLTKKIDLGIRYSNSSIHARERNVENGRYNTRSTFKTDSLVRSFTDSEMDRKSNSVAAYFDYRINSSGKKMSVAYNYAINHFDPFRNVNSAVEILDSNDEAKASVRYLGNNKFKNSSVFLDFYLPGKFMTVDVGGAYTHITNRSSLETFNLIGGSSIFDPLESNDFSYTEKTPALYLSANKEISKRWSAKMGLRYENTFLEGFSPTLGIKNISRYDKLFPTAYLLFTPENNAFSLSYSRRIERPYFSDLNPFRVFYGRYSYVSGNPFLAPSFSHNTELTYTLKNNLTTVAYFSKVSNGIGTISLLTNGVVSTTPENYLNQTRAGIDISYRFNLFRFLALYSSSNLFYNESKSEKDALGIPSTNGFGGSFRIQGTIYFNAPKTSILSIGYSHTLPSRDGFYEISSYGLLSANYRYTFPGKKWSLLFSGYDIFNQRKVIRTINYTNSTLTSTQQPRVRSMSVSINFSFGNKNVRAIDRGYKIDKQRAS